MGGREKMLAAVFDPAHRMVDFERQRRDHRLFGRQPRLRAEAAADVGRDHPDAAFLEIEHLGQSQPDDVRDLRRAVDHELIEPMVAIGEHRASLERHRDLPVHPVVAAHDHVGGARHRLDVAAANSRSMNRLLLQPSCTRLGALPSAAAASITAGSTS